MINGWLTGFLMSSYLGKRYICLKQYQPLVRDPSENKAKNSNTVRSMKVVSDKE